MNNDSENSNIDTQNKYDDYTHVINTRWKNKSNWRQNTKTLGYYAYQNFLRKADSAELRKRIPMIEKALYNSNLPQSEQKAAIG